MAADDVTNDELVGRLLELFDDVVGEPAVHGLGTVRGDMDAWDSVAHVRLIYVIERTFEVEIPDTLLTTDPSLAEIATALDEARKASA